METTLDIHETTPSGARAVLIDEPRKFDIHELFFSTTNPSGIIEAGNEVFVRVSGYSWPEMHRKAHSLIRHPDMPRCVFRLLWDTIQAGQMIAAYVKNRAKDGRYYWVMALVQPIEGGYLSVRFKPSSDLLPVVEGLYRDLRALELAVERKGGTRKAAIEKSAGPMAAALAGLGFAGYDQFMHHALHRELRSRDAKIAATDDRATADAENESVNHLARCCDAVLKVLRQLFASLDSHTAIMAQIRETEKSTRLLAEAVTCIALNAGVESNRLGQRGAVLEPICDWLGQSSARTADLFRILSEKLLILTRETAASVFDLGAARLQIEMISVFAREMDLLAGDGAAEDLVRRDRDSILALLAAFESVTAQALASLDAVRQRIGDVRRAQHSVNAVVRTLHFTYMAGKVEIARLADDANLHHIFGQLSEKLKNSEADAMALDAAVSELDSRFETCTVGRMALEQSIAALAAERRRISRT